MRAHSTTAFKTIRNHLFEDHRRLEDLFDQLLDAFEAGEHQPLTNLWTRFETDLLRHMDFEERFLVPQFQRSEPDAAAAILVDHGEFRHRLAELGIGVDLHIVRLTAARNFIRRLREHANREDDLMYRWSDEHFEEHERTLMIHAFRPRDADSFPSEHVDA